MRHRLFPNGLTFFRLVPIAMVLSVAAHGQSAGTIHGTVKDHTGLPISGAQVTAVHEERGTNRALTTDNEGNYVLAALPVGAYTIRVSAPGFKLFERRGVGLTANQNARIDISLAVGEVSDSVSVTADAPLVDGRSATVGALIDSRRVTELPIDGRNIIALAVILPGVSDVAAPQTFTGDRSGPAISVSGSRGNANQFLFDGAPFNALFRNTGQNYPPPDALREVQALTNSYSAEYGRNSGAIFNVVTKSGTNQLHGSAWEFHRNHKLNARNFFAAEKPQLIQNQFGFTFGGPIRKDELFAFGSYEGLRIRPASLSTSGLPLTEAERRGDFSSILTPLRDPLGGTFPQNQIPISRFDPVAANIISKGLMPLPNRSDGQFVTSFPTPQNNNTYLIRLDQNLGRHTIDGHFNHNLANERSFSGNIPTYLPASRDARSYSITVGDTFTLRPNLLNVARLSYNRFLASIVTLSGLHHSDLGGALPLFGPKIPPALNISGRVQLGNNSAVDSFQLNEAYQFSDSLTWNKGNHTVKAGFELSRLHYINESYFLTMGDFNFTGAITGNAAADFLLGQAQSMMVASPALINDERQTNTYYFIQDDWRIHPRLTLNLGLRYELSLPWTDGRGLGIALRPGQQSEVIPSAPTGMVFPGDPGVPPGLVETDKNNFAPRFGFAWSPFGDNRTSVRAAYGIFYESVNADIVQWTGSQPFRYTFTFPRPFSLTDPLRGQPPIPLEVNLTNPVFVGRQQLFLADPHLRSPYVQQFNLNVQREVIPDLAIQIGYVGRLGRKLLMTIESNPAIFGPGATLQNLDPRRILQPFGPLNRITSQSNSSYHALQVAVTKRYSQGFSLQGAYTFSRSLDMFSGIALGAAVPNVFDLSSQYGLSDFHAKHVGSFSWIWDLPKFTRSHPVLRAVAGGWQVNGLVSLRSGLPINILAGADVALSGTSNQRPNLIKDPELPDDRSRGEKILAWFDRTAFARPDNGTFGNLGRNALIGPSYSATNLGLFKNIDLPGREGMRLQFRSEFFNLFNNVNLGNPNVNLTAGTNMGQITSAREARVIQFALKLYF
jgi:outer membrane receptor protein involved in Fe transport